MNNLVGNNIIVRNFIAIRWAMSCNSRIARIIKKIVKSDIPHGWSNNRANARKDRLPYPELLCQMQDQYANSK
jgi:hypothetical protein